MTYKEYPGRTKTYVVVHNTGFGVMEAPYEEKEVVYETDNYSEAESKAKEFFINNNSPEEIRSTWCANTYSVNVNTLSEEGKILLTDFRIESNKRSEEFKEYLRLHPDEYNSFNVNGRTFHLKKMKDFN